MVTQNYKKISWRRCLNGASFLYEENHSLGVWIKRRLMLCPAALADTVCAGIAIPGQNQGSGWFHPKSSQKPCPT
jgi:hypothetical protein